MIVNILSLIGILAGIVIMATGGLWGLLLLLAGSGAIAIRYATLMRASGFHPNRGSINGLDGQGEQLNFGVQDPQPSTGEQPANIWDTVEKK